jgi:hypothetical protein
VVVVVAVVVMRTFETSVFPDLLRILSPTWCNGVDIPVTLESCWNHTYQCRLSILYRGVDSILSLLHKSVVFLGINECCKCFWQNPLFPIGCGQSSINCSAYGQTRISSHFILNYSDAWYIENGALYSHKTQLHESNQGDHANITSYYKLYT